MNKHSINAHCPQLGAGCTDAAGVLGVPAAKIDVYLKMMPPCADHLCKTISCGGIFGDVPVIQTPSEGVPTHPQLYLDQGPAPPSNPWGRAP